MNVGAFNAKTHFSELLDNVKNGMEITITKRGKPVAVLKPLKSEKRRKRKEVVSEILKYRVKSAKGMNIKELINEGRR